MATRMANCSVEHLASVKQIVETNLPGVVNNFLASGDWILIDICRGKYARRVYVLGRIR